MQVHAHAHTHKHTHTHTHTHIHTYRYTGPSLVSKAFFFFETQLIKLDPKRVDVLPIIPIYCSSLDYNTDDGKLTKNIFSNHLYIGCQYNLFSKLVISFNVAYYILCLYTYCKLGYSMCSVTGTFQTRLVSTLIPNHYHCRVVIGTCLCAVLLSSLCLVIVILMLQFCF